MSHVVNGTRQSGSRFPPRKKRAICLPEATKAADATAADGVCGKFLRLIRTVQPGIQNIDPSHGLSGSEPWALWRISAQPASRGNGPGAAHPPFHRQQSARQTRGAWFRAQGTARSGLRVLPRGSLPTITGGRNAQGGDQCRFMELQTQMLPMRATIFAGRLNAACPPFTPQTNIDALRWRSTVF